MRQSVSRNQICNQVCFQVCLWLLYLTCSLGPLDFKAAAQTRPSAAAAHAGAPPAKFALLIGINHYKYPDRVSPLAGSLNDVDDMRQLLIGKYDFPAANIVTLKDTQATHSAILQAIETQLIARASPGDIVVLHYSGHGSQMKDVTGKSPDGLDETIVPYDSRDPAGQVFDISGAELHPLLLRLAAKTTNLTFILDSCHSGTLVRGLSGGAVRAIDPDTRTPPTRGVSTGERGLAPPTSGPAPRYAVIAAATSRESAFEHFAEGRDHGALTYFLTRQLRTARAGATYRDVMDSVIGNVESNYPTQHASLEGAEADQHVFGDGSSLARAYTVASPAPGDPKHIRLDAGQVQGVTVGSEYDVYPPGSKLLHAPEQPVAHVQVSSVDPLDALCIALSGQNVPAASRAVERKHRFGSSRLRVYLDGPADAGPISSLRTALAGVRYIEIAPRASQANIIVRLANDHLAVLAPDLTTLSPPISLDDTAATDRIVAQVEGWARWFNVLSIRNSQPEINLQFTLSKGATRDAMARIGHADVTVADGDSITATLTNSGDRDIYIAIVDLSSDGSVSVVFPAPGAQQVVKQGATLVHSFRTFVPKGRQNATDTLKAFASYQPIDLSPLNMRAIRSVQDFSAAPDELEELLMDAAGDTRGVVPLLSKPTSLGTWTTAERTLLVRRPG